ncbi:MAG: hypothetical protein KAH25_10155 [Bacteroidales bacterium]|nr:hypothetical protein [Bacteroidales bacterium]
MKTIFFLVAAFILISFVSCEKGNDFGDTKVEYRISDASISSPPTVYESDVIITKEVDSLEVWLTIQTAYGDYAKFNIETPTQKSDYIANDLTYDIICNGIYGGRRVEGKSGYKMNFRFDINDIRKRGCPRLGLESAGDTIILKSSIDNMMSKDLVIIYK